MAITLKQCLVLGAALIPFFCAPANAATPVTPCFAVDCVNFPADAGFINVKDYGAVGNGIADDTAAINAALAASDGGVDSPFGKSRIVYLPLGTYLVTSPLYKAKPNGDFSSGMILLGQSRQGTIIKLGNSAEGYTNPAQQRAIILTTSDASYDAQTLKGIEADQSIGEGNRGYANFVENLTIDAGSGNLGAIGIDYLANKFGAVRSVTLRAAADSGKIGIRMLRKWAGPVYLQDDLIDGFNIGVAVRQADLSVSLDKLTLNNQRQWGLYNNNSLVSLRALRTNNTLTPIVNSGAKSLMFLNGGAFYHTNGVDSDIITNTGSMNIRNLGMRGYGLLFGKTPEVFANGVYAQEGTFEGNTKKSSAFQTWSSMPVDPPAVPNTPVGEWVSVDHPGSGLMATAALRAALASGADTIYLPHGLYEIDENIVIPPNVQRIVGMFSTIKAVASDRLDASQPFFRTSNGTVNLMLEKLNFTGAIDGLTTLEHAGARTLTLRDVTMEGKKSVRRLAGAGTLFVESFSGGQFVLEGTSNSWMRQVNIESDGGTCISNGTGRLWVHGLKSQGQCTVIKNTGGNVEVMSALLHANTDTPSPIVPAFHNIGGKMLLSYIEETYDNTAGYVVHFVNTLAGTSRAVLASMLPARDNGRMVTQLVSSFLANSVPWNENVPVEAPNPEITTGYKFGEGFGINIKLERITKPELDLIASLGIKRVRVGVAWYAVEYTPGQYRWDIQLPRRDDADDYATKKTFTYDEMFAAIRERGLKLDVTLHEGNAGITGLVNMAAAGQPPAYRHGAPRTPEHIAMFANFAARTVQHYEGIYGKDAFGWHIWNEPDTDMGFAPKTDAGIVGKLLTQSCEAIRRVSPSASVMGPALGAYGGGDIRYDFLLGMFSQSNPLSCVDAITVHPYRSAVPETAPIDYARMQQVMAPFQPAGNPKPVAVDEWAYSINKLYSPISSQTWRNRTEAEQAALMFRMYMTNIQAGLPLTVLYDWRNNGTNPYEWEHHFGVVGYNLEQKAPQKMFAYVWPQLMDRIVQEGGAPNGCSTKEHMMRFGSRTNDAYAGLTVLWTDNTAPRTLYIQGTVEKVTDMFGNNVVPTVTGTGVSLSVGNYPLLVRHAKGGRNPLTLSCNTVLASAQ